MRFFEEVANLYIGCDVIADGMPLELRSVGLYGFVLDTKKGDNKIIGKWGYIYFQPILRLLSSMTDEEKLHLAELSYPQYSFSKLSNKMSDYASFIAINQDDIGCHVSLETHNSNSFLWLLSERFDLFNLIETGQALDKNKIIKQ